MILIDMEVVNNNSNHSSSNNNSNISSNNNNISNSNNKGSRNNKMLFDWINTDFPLTNKKYKTESEKEMRLTK